MGQKWVKSGVSPEIDQFETLKSPKSGAFRGLRVPLRFRFSQNKAYLGCTKRTQNGTKRDQKGVKQTPKWSKMGQIPRFPGSHDFGVVEKPIFPIHVRSIIYRIIHFCNVRVSSFKGCRYGTKEARMARRAQKGSKKGYLAPLNHV